MHFLDKGSFIRELRSPSHPIAVTTGSTSKGETENPIPSQASATLSLGLSQLDRDFVLEIILRGAATPRALLETHPTPSRSKSFDDDTETEFRSAAIKTGNNFRHRQKR